MIVVVLCLFSILITVNGDFDLNNIVDLSWDYDNNTINWPTAQKFEFIRKIKSSDGYWYAMNDFCTGEHAGTHLDAPYHFYEHGWKVGDVPLNKLVAKGAFIDLEAKVHKFGTNTTLDVEDLENWEKTFEPFENGTILLVKFGWSKYWATDKFLGVDSQNNKHFPSISAEAARWLVNSKKFNGIGVDVASTDLGLSKDYIVHRTLSEKNIFAMENVKLLRNLPVRNFTLFVMPMKIKDGTGAPARILAVPSNFSL